MAEPRTTPDLPRRIHILEEKQYAKQRAGDLAAEQIEQDKASLTGIVGFCKRYIKHNLLEDYTRQKEYYRQLDKINNEGNPFSTEQGEDPRAFDDVVASVLKRFDFEHEGEANIYLKQGLGETRTKLEKTDQRHTQVVQIISNYAEGLITDENALTEIIGTQIIPVKDKSNANSQYMHDIVSVANTVRANIDQYRALGRLEDVLEVYVGNAVIGANTESYQTRVDKIVEWVGNKKILNVISQETLASALTIASTIAVQGGTRIAQGVGFSAGSVFGSALVGGAIGGLRDRTRFNRELRQHMRDKVQGKQAVDQSTNSKRAKFEQERVLFETKDAHEIVAELETAIADYTTSPTEANLNTMLRVLGESRARTHFVEYGFTKHKGQIQPGGTHNIGTRIDLINYPDIAQVSTLNDRIRDLQATITRTIRAGKNSDPVVQQRIPGDLDEFLVHVKQVHMTNLTMGDSGIAKTVERIEKMRGRRAKKTAGVGAVVGFGIGTIGQELHALASSSKVGILEDLYSRAKGDSVDLGHKDQTLLEQILNRATGRKAEVGIYDQHLPANERVEFVFDKDTTVTKNTSGTYDITQNGQTVRDLRIDAKGQLDPASVKKLENYNIKFHTEAGPSIQTTQNKNTLEYLADIQDNPQSKYHEFANDVKVINRDYSEDQLVYEQLKIGWASKNGELIGRIPIPSTQTKAGADIFRDPGVLRTMKVVLTVNAESGHKVIEVPVQAVQDGFEVRVGKNHPAFWLFEQQGTSVQFKGLQAELAQGGGTANKDAIYNFFGRETNAKGLDTIKEVVTDGTETKGVKIVIEAASPNQPWSIPGSYVVNPIKPMGTTQRTPQQATNERGTPANPTSTEHGTQNPETGAEIDAANESRLIEIQSPGFLINLQQRFNNIDFGDDDELLNSGLSTLAHIRHLLSLTSLSPSQQSQLLQKVRHVEAICNRYETSTPTNTRTETGIEVPMAEWESPFTITHNEVAQLENKIHAMSLAGSGFNIPVTELTTGFLLVERLKHWLTEDPTTFNRPYIKDEMRLDVQNIRNWFKTHGVDIAETTTSPHDTAPTPTTAPIEAEPSTTTEMLNSRGKIVYREIRKLWDQAVQNNLHMPTSKTHLSYYDLDDSTKLEKYVLFGKHETAVRKNVDLIIKYKDYITKIFSDVTIGTNVNKPKVKNVLRLKRKFLFLPFTELDEQALIKVIATQNPKIVEAQKYAVQSDTEIARNNQLQQLKQLNTDFDEIAMQLPKADFVSVNKMLTDLQTLVNTKSLTTGDRAQVGKQLEIVKDKIEKARNTNLSTPGQVSPPPPAPSMPEVNPQVPVKMAKFETKLNEIWQSGGTNMPKLVLSPIFKKYPGLITGHATQIAENLSLLFQNTILKEANFLKRIKSVVIDTSPEPRVAYAKPDDKLPTLYFNPEIEMKYKDVENILSQLESLGKS